MLALSFVVVIVFWHASTGSTQLRILEGNNAEVGRYPFVISMQTNALGFYVHVCTGSLITHSWVLTAAHCFMGNPSVIRYGNMLTNNSEEITRNKIVNAYPHPNYLLIYTPDRKNVAYVRNDIGLVQIESVHLREYGKLSAIDYSTLVGYPIKVLGYGLTTIKVSENMEIILNSYAPLQEAEGMVAKCGEEILRISSMFICLSPKCSKLQYSLPGDSGGPLLHLGKIAGVGSQGEAPLTMGIYWPVSPYFSWIRDTINLND